jgi:thymidylate synthase (FAD)
MNTSKIRVSHIDGCGNDLSVVNAARVSFDKQSSFEESVDGHHWVLPEQDKKLIKYLAKHKHTSPFNHAFASFRVKAPIFVARQLVKHKFLPWNEVSRRYVDSDPEFYIPQGWRKRANNVKQGSSEEPAEVSEQYITDIVDMAVRDYHYLLESGVCPEQARMVLPQNMMTEWIWSGTLGAWADMCRLRLDPHTQYETRLVAQEISERMALAFPVSWEALMSKDE